MIKIENVEVVGWEHAIRGMRNPKNSWDKSDSGWVDFEDWDCGHGIPDGAGWAYVIGSNDLDLMKRLAKAGTDHRKFMRMIVVYADVTAPLYWWYECDTYKVGTVRNSCSKMHKITEKEFTLEDFSCEHLINTCLLELVINELNIYRGIYNNYDRQTEHYKTEFSKKDIWWQMIQLLPSSYNQRSTLMLNYEVLANMYHSRKTHKLDEWCDFCKWIESLPYAKELICDDYTL